MEHAAVVNSRDPDLYLHVPGGLVTNLFTGVIFGNDKTAFDRRSPVMYFPAL